MVTIVDLAGQDITCRLEAGLTSKIGRDAVRDTGKPGYLTAVLLDVIPTIGDRVGVVTDGQIRALGWISDAAVTVPDGDAVTDLTAMGPLARQVRAVTGLPWPPETVAARAQRLAAMLEAPIVVQGGDEQRVTGVEVDDAPDTAGQALAELATSTGGWLYDLAGVIYLQALDHRKVTAITARWDDEPDHEPWTALDAQTTWNDETSPPGTAPLILNCAMIDAALTWEITDDLVNVVTVEYGAKQTVTVEDADSITAAGRQPVTIKTSLVERGDALELAQVTLNRAAWPQWALSTVTVTAADLDPITRTALADAHPGTRVTITGIPHPHPQRHYAGVLEGWAETWDHNSDPQQHRITLALSHIAHSLAVPIWDAEPTDAHWTDLDDDLTWEGDLT